MDVFGIFRKPLPKEPYESPEIRQCYKKLAETIAKLLLWFKRRGYTLVAILGAEGSPRGMNCPLTAPDSWMR